MIVAIALLLICQQQISPSAHIESLEKIVETSPRTAAPSQDSSSHDEQPPPKVFNAINEGNAGNQQRARSGDASEVAYGIQPVFESSWESVPKVPLTFFPLARTSSDGAIAADRSTNSKMSDVPGMTANFVAPTATGLIRSSLPNFDRPLAATGDSNSISAFEDATEAAPDATKLPGVLASFATQKVPSPAGARRESQLTPKQSRWSLVHFLRRQLGQDLGIGHERVMYAPMVVETAIGTSSTSVVMRLDRGLGTPDRLEYIWATPGRGPNAEARVDLIDTVYRLDLGNEKLMVMTEYTMRALNPDRADNTVGFGDMVIGTKATILDGRCTKVASVFRTYLKTGPADRGLGTGHVALEPGVLLRRQLSPKSFFHGELKYWIPIAGTPSVAGDVLRIGAAYSTIWRETDRYALLPTLELSTYTFLAGAKTNSLGLTERVNGEFAAELYPGMRCVLGGSEFGLVELGIASAAVFADDGWFDSRIRFEFRLAR